MRKLGIGLLAVVAVVAAGVLTFGSVIQPNSVPEPKVAITPVATSALTAAAPTIVPPYVAPRDRLDTGLMTIYIDTQNQAAITADADTPGDFTMSASTATPECRGLQKSAATFNVRGNTTAELPKKPYTIHLGESQDLCGMGKNKKWTLLANWNDRTLLRNAASFYLGRQLDHLAFTPQTYPADVYVNSAYVGSYELVESISVDKQRVNIDELNQNQSGKNDTGVNLTGGYLLEWDYRQKANHVFAVGNHGYVGLRDPDDEVDGSGVTAAQVAYITDYVNKAEQALYDGDTFLDPDKGWRHYIDADAAVDYYLAQEFTKTYDGAFYSSVYMYKTRDTAAGPGKLFLGPMWDYDESLGNGTTPEIFHSPEGWYLQGYDSGHDERQSSATWFDRLMEDPTFVEQVKQRWCEVYPRLQTTPSFITERAALIEKSAKANFALWDPRATDDPGPLPKGTTLAKQNTYLLDWVNARLEWMNGKLG